MADVKKGDFIELKYRGYSNGALFDSNIEEEVKKIHPEAKGEKTIVVIGQGMVVAGLDRALEGKEIGKEYEVKVGCKEGFGERKKEFIKTIPLKVFTENKIAPQTGMGFTLDGQLVRVIAVSGARVITDFNNPLAGKELDYKFEIVRKVEDEKEKTEALFKNLFRMMPEFSVEGEKIVVKGAKRLEVFVAVFKEKFKELIGKELVFEEIKKEGKEEGKVDNLEKEKLNN